MRATFLSSAAALFLVCATGSVQAAGQPRIRQAIDEARLQTLKGNVHPLAIRQFDRGAATPDLPMERMLLVLSRSTEQQQALDQLMDAVHNPNSPQFHQWLTPEQFGQQFGAADEDVQTVTAWLKSHGFTVARVSRGKTAIEFSGTAEQVQEAFHTSIHKFVVNGTEHWANASDPQIPAALAPVVAGVATLHNFSKKPQLRAAASPVEAIVRGSAAPEFTSSNGIYALAPADYATIYNINPLYGAGIDGTGAAIAVVGRTNINLSDIVSFRSLFGLSSNAPQIVINGVNPGNLGGDEEAEAVLDTSWSGAVAPSATINLVISKTTNATDGVDLSEEYIINNNLADVMTESFGDCEANYTRAQAVFYSNLAAQAALQGITYLVASGDSGAAGCDSPDQTAAIGPVSVSILASNPYVVAVGGTQFNENGNYGAYWAPFNFAARNSALSYIPEVVWNESCSVAQCGSGNAALWAGGGGASIYFAKPSWQTGVTGIPNDGARDVPDVSLTAAGHDAYLLCIDGSCTPNSRGRISFEGYGGTSAATPSFAGLMALVVQKTGQRQGQANYTLYRLAATQNLGQCNGSSTAILTGGSACIFNDVTVGNNAVPGEANYGTLNAQYQAGVGYDLATGLGSVNATNMVNGWASALVIVNSPALTLSATGVDFGSLNLGQPATQTVTLTDTGNAPLVFSSPLSGTSFGFSWTSDCPGSLSPGASCSLQITFTPASVGAFSAAISVYDNASSSPQTIALSGSAVAASVLTASPAGVNFGSLKVLSRSAVQTVQISNTTSQAINIYGITATGGNAADFTVANNCPGSLAPGSTCSAYVVFSPQMAGGRFASLTVANSDASSPQVIPLSGTGAMTGAFEIFNAATGKVLEVENGSTNNGALIRQNNLSGQAQQQWKFVPAGGGYYAITNVLTGKVLDVTGASLTNGTAIQQYDYLGYGNQQWQLVVSDDAHYRIVNQSSGKALDIPGGSTLNGTAVQQWDVNGSGQQLWTLVPVQSYSVVNSNSSDALDIRNGSATSGTTIQQSAMTGNRQQQWQFVPTGGGYYAIANRSTGKVLDVTAASQANGAVVQEYDYLDYGNQQWQLLLVDATQYQIRNRNSGKVLDVTGFSTVSGTTIQQWDYLSGSNQLWQITPVVLYNIANRDSGQVLDVPSGSLANGTVLQQWGSNGNQQQQWQLIPTDNGYYQIVNDFTGKVLDVVGGSNSNGVLIQQYDFLDYGNQQWLLAPTDPGYYKIVNRQSGKVLDVIGASTNLGAQVQQYNYLGYSNQQWSLIPAGN